MQRHSLETIYRKMNINGRIIPAEWEIVIKDLVKRVVKLEEAAHGQHIVEKPSTPRQGTRKVPKKKVSSS